LRSKRAPDPRRRMPAKKAWRGQILGFRGWMVFIANVPTPGRNELNPKLLTSGL